MSAVTSGTTEVPPTAPVAAGEASGLSCLVGVARHHGLHLTPTQLVRDNLLPAGEVSGADLVRCARSAGLSATLMRLGASGIGHTDEFCRRSSG